MKPSAELQEQAANCRTSALRARRWAPNLRQGDAAAKRLLFYADQLEHRAAELDAQAEVSRARAVVGEPVQRNPKNT